MKSSKFFEPYYEKGKKDLCTLKASHETSVGVYLIRDKESKKILYIGHSTSNLYKTLYRHFQSWKDKQYRATFDKYKTEVRIITTTEKQAQRLERFLIRKYRPGANEVKHKEIIENDSLPVTLTTITEMKKEDVFSEDWMNLKFNKPTKQTFKRK